MFISCPVVLCDGDLSSNRFSTDSWSCVTWNFFNWRFFLLVLSAGISFLGCCTSQPVACFILNSSPLTCNKHAPVFPSTEKIWGDNISWTATVLWNKIRLTVFCEIFRKVEHVYMRPKVNSNRFEMSFRLHGNLHGDFTGATLQTIGRPYCTCANDIFN